MVLKLKVRNARTLYTYINIGGRKYTMRQTAIKQKTAPLKNILPKITKTFEDISLFLTTQDAIRFSKDNINIWKEVE